jgi:hypothetical protein
MTAHEAVGYILLNASAITAITSTRITHGLRPKDTAVPCINFYELGGGDRWQGMERSTFSINCRAATAKVARQLARLVIDEFDGTYGNGTYGQVSSFSVGRASLASDNGIVMETEDRIYNAPVDVTLVYASSAVS